MASLSDEKAQSLEAIAAKIRRDTVEAVIRAGSGHIAGPLDLADIFTALYFHVLKHDPKNPLWEERDRLVLSNGPLCSVQYAAMAHAGYFPLEELKTLREFGSRLQGHPHRPSLPGLETSSGPLGSGLSQAVGMALGFKMDGKKNAVYCIMSDAEQQCGQTWEAAMLAGKHELDNLTAIIDRNNIQIDGMTEKIMPLEPLREKYEAFNWHVLEVDGHNIEAIADVCDEARAIYAKPVVVLAHTIAGKGVDFMEFDFRWHSKSFKPEEAKDALRELRTLGGKIENPHAE